MATFNRIEQSVYTTLLSHSTLDGGTIQVEYALGVMDEQDGVVNNFRPLVSQWYTIEAEQAQALISQPLTKDDVGKTPDEVMKARIYEHLKATNTILV